MQWLLSLRNEIARRRIFCGRVALVAEEGVERGVVWGREHGERLTHLRQEMHHEDLDAQDATARGALLDLVIKREYAAAAYGVTGPHLSPHLLDLERIGAQTTASITFPPAHVGVHLKPPIVSATER